MFEILSIKEYKYHPAAIIALSIFVRLEAEIKIKGGKMMKKKELLKYLEKFNDDDRVMIDIGSWNNHWKYADVVEEATINTVAGSIQVIAIR